MRADEQSGAKEAAVNVHWVARVGLAGAAMVLVAAFAHPLWLLSQPPYVHYGLHAPTAEQRVVLNGLGAADVVRTYLESRDLSVVYWLEDDVRRAYWHQRSYEPDSEQVAANAGLQVGPVEDPAASVNADHRAFKVSYTGRIRGDFGDQPRLRRFVIDVVRASGGPWRISAVRSQL
jgi:hypothetical protein